MLLKKNNELLSDVHSLLFLSAKSACFTKQASFYLTVKLISTTVLIWLNPIQFSCNISEIFSEFEFACLISWRSCDEELQVYVYKNTSWKEVSTCLHVPHTTSTVSNRKIFSQTQIPKRTFYFPPYLTSGSLSEPFALLSVSLR